MNELFVLVRRCGEYEQKDSELIGVFDSFENATSGRGEFDRVDDRSWIAYIGEEVDDFYILYKVVLNKNLDVDLNHPDHYFYNMV